MRQQIEVGQRQQIVGAGQQIIRGQRAGTGMARRQQQLAAVDLFAEAPVIVACGVLQFATKRAAQLAEPALRTHAEQHIQANDWRASLA